MKKLCFFLITALTLSLFQSCEKDPIDNQTEEVAPKIPPQESFIMPFTGFEEVDTTEFTDVHAEARSVETFQNWFYAGTNILVWNTVLTLNLAVPVASFGEAFNHDPVYAGNGVFEWAYSYNHLGSSYNAVLSGQFINNGADVEWVMSISKVGGFSDVVYYTGVVAADHSEANWTLYHRPLNPEPYLGISYQKDASTNDFTIRYTNVVPNSPDNGQYIEYRTSSDSNFNRAYDVFLNTNNFLEMEWNEPANNGRVKNPHRFNDEEWHCWDIDLSDIDC